MRGTLHALAVSCVVGFLFATFEFYIHFGLTQTDWFRKFGGSELFYAARLFAAYFVPAFFLVALSELAVHLVGMLRKRRH